MSKRILIISDSIYRQTGYSTVTKNIIKNLDPSYTVAQLGLSHIPADYINNNQNIDYYSPILKHKDCCNSNLTIEHFDCKTNNVEVITPDVNLTSSNDSDCQKGIPNSNDPYSFESAYYVIEHFKPDVVLAINDVWGMYKLNFLKNRSKFKFFAYLAVDSECFPLSIQNKETINTMQFVDTVDKLVVFTKWAKKTVNKSAKLSINKTFDNIEVIPHGVDLDKFSNLSNRDEIVSKLYNLDTKDVFIIGSVNRNQPRKRLDAIFQILQILKNKYEKKNGRKFMVHFHCAIQDSHGWNLPWLARYYGVEDRVILDQNLKPGLGVPDELLNLIMNSYDVHLVPTNSEGWGLSILETMACGIPNVISDYSAHGDWAKDASLKIKLAAKIHEPITNHIKGIIDINHAAKQISLLYNSKQMIKDYTTKSLKLADKLQWSNICVRWNELFNGVEASTSYEEVNLLDIENILPFPTDPLTTEFPVQEI